MNKRRRWKAKRARRVAQYKTWIVGNVWFATDDDARAAGQRVMDGRHVLMARLAAHDGPVGQAADRHVGIVEVAGSKPAGPSNSG